MRKKYSKEARHENGHKRDGWNPSWSPCFMPKFIALLCWADISTRFFVTIHFGLKIFLNWWLEVLAFYEPYLKFICSWCSVLKRSLLFAETFCLVYEMLRFPLFRRLIDWYPAFILLFESHWLVFWLILKSDCIAMTKVINKNKTHSRNLLYN